MEAAGLVEVVFVPRVLRFNFEDVGKLPPPIIAFTDVAFAYDGNMKNALYQDLSMGIEYAAAASVSFIRFLMHMAMLQYGLACCYRWQERYWQINTTQSYHRSAATDKRQCVPSRRAQARYAISPSCCNRLTV